MVVSILNRKLYRDLIHLKAQVASIGIVVALGIATLFGFTSTEHSLRDAQQRVYAELEFPDIFADVKKASLTELNRIRRLQGVASVEARLTFDGLVSIPDFPEPAVGRFISIPDGKQPNMSQIYIKQGRIPAPLSEYEVVVHESFFEAHGFHLGQQFQATLNGRRRDLRIVGVGVSPEHIFPSQAGSPMPDNLHFGVMWVNQRTLEAAYDMRGAFNSVILRLEPKASQYKIIDQVDVLLDQYGTLGAYTREDQTSHRFVSEELKQLRVQAITVPVIFFLVAAFILNVVLSRMVTTQRSEIATLKAVGYYNNEIGGYYFKIAAIVVLTGSVLGLIGGLGIGQSMTSLYSAFYKFPVLKYSFSYGNMVLATGISFLIAFLGVYFSFKKIAMMSPAESMRPPMPQEYHRNIFEGRLYFQLLRVRPKMIVRGITASLLRSVLTGLGVSASVSLLITGLFWGDSIDYLIMAQYTFAQKETGTVVLSHPLEKKVVYEVARMDGVVQAEGYRTVPIKVRHKNIKLSTSLTGVPTDARLKSLLNKGMQEIKLSEDAVYVSASIAKQLGVSVGDRIIIDVLEGTRPVVELTVNRIIDTFLTSEIVTSSRRVSRILKEADLVNAVAFRSIYSDNTRLYTSLKERPNVISVNFRRAALESFEETSAKFLLVFAAILSFFAGAITFGIIYNNARVTLSERDWELSTLRILGFRQREIYQILVGEIAVLTATFIPLGCIWGYVQARALATQMMPEDFQLPFKIDLSTYAFTIIIVNVAAAISGWFVWSKLRQLDIVETLKARG